MWASITLIGKEPWKEFIVHIKRFMFPQSEAIIFLKLLNNTFAITNDYNQARHESYNS